VRSSWSTIAIQVLSRCFITFAICTTTPEVAERWPFVMMVLSWALTEVIRYAYFVVDIVLGQTPRWLTYIRFV